MLKLLIAFAIMAITTGQYFRPLILNPFPQSIRPFKFNSPYFNYDYEVRVEPLHLCTYTDVDFSKCTHTVHVARNNSIDLNLECVRKDKRENCIHSVEIGTSDMVVLTGHDYKEARRRGLMPMIFAKEDDNSLYIAVAPRNITLIDLQEAPIYVDLSKHRAFHAATFFNLMMDHDICALAKTADLVPYIHIVDSSVYVKNSEEILICPNRLPAEFEDYKHCNIEASLQRAVFVNSNLSPEHHERIRKTFDTIFERFGPNSATEQTENDKSFNFFDTFDKQDDVIFKKNTISFDLQPTYHNGVDEKLFNYLHCNHEDQPLDPRVLS